MRSIRLVAIAVVAGFVCVGTPGLMAPDWRTIAALFGFTVLLDLFDLWLPHGDNISVDGALAASSLVIAGPWAALAISVAARLIAGLLRGDSTGLLPALEKRLVGLTAGAAVIALLLQTEVTVGVTVTSLLVSSTLLLAELLYAQALSARGLHRGYFQLVTGNMRLQAPILIAQVSVCGLAVMTHQQMNAWSLIVAVVLLLLIRQSYASLLEVRQAYGSTVELLIDAAEGIDESRRGHAERTAAVARQVGRRLGVGASEMERLSYAALLHDVDLISRDSGADGAGQRRAGLVIQDVEFLREVAPILRVCDGAPPPEASESDLRDAFIVALASDIDAHAEARPALALRRVSSSVPAETRGRVVGAAVALGLALPGLGD